MKPFIVILWWGSDLRLRRANGSLAARMLASAEDPVPAILKLLGDECPDAKSIRLIYHPETLAVHEIACPKVNRTRLRKILAKDFPTLDATDAIWSAEPIRQGQAGPGTVLYIDHGSALPRLLGGLDQRRVAVEGIWPLQSLLNATEVSETCGEGSMSLVATSTRALVSSGGAAGDRMVRFHSGPEFVEATIAEMRTVHARLNEEEGFPGQIAVEDGPSAVALRQAASAYDMVPSSMASLLWGAQFLEKGGFSNFLRVPSLADRPKAFRAVLAFLGIVLLAGGLGYAWTNRHEDEKRQKQLAAMREQDENLRQIAAKRSAAHGRMDGLGQDLMRVDCPPQPQYEFLKTVAETAPESLALQALAIEDSAFAISGHIYEGAGRTDGPLPAFQRKLAASGAPWRLSDPAKDTSPDFTFRGNFQFPSQPAPGPADLETRLAGARARLPSAKDFDEWMQGWGQSWKLESRSTEGFPGLEVRHYRLTLGRPSLDAWPQIVGTVKSLCAEPGLSIDRIALASAPDGSDAFTEAQVGFTVRLRR